MVALVLAALWGVEPILGQTAQREDGSRHNPEKQTNGSQNPSVPTLTIIQKNCDSEAFKNDSDCKATKDKQSTVAVSKLPTAHVTIDGNAPRDRYDWVAYIGSLLLVVAGLGGIGVGITTLCYLRKQAAEMQLQRKAMVRTLTEIRRQADLMDIQAGEARESGKQTFAVLKEQVEANKKLLMPLL